MTKKEYNGWFNYETWLVKLWIDNEEGSCRYWEEVASEAWESAVEDRTYPSQTRKESACCILADRLKESHEASQEELFSGVNAGIFVDLLNAAMSEVNWYEVAENMLEEFEEESVA